jgi:hypothetical protein
MNNEIKKAVDEFHQWYCENLYESAMLIIELRNFVPFISELARVAVEDGTCISNLDFVLDGSDDIVMTYHTNKPIFKYAKGKLTREDL